MHFLTTSVKHKLELRGALDRIIEVELALGWPTKVSLFTVHALAMSHAWAIILVEKAQHNTVQTNVEIVKHKMYLSCMTRPCKTSWAVSCHKLTVWTWRLTACHKANVPSSGCVASLLARRQGGPYCQAGRIDVR